MISCHTPFSDEALVEEYKDEFILVSGLGRVLEVALSYGYRRALDIEELFALFPESIPQLNVPKHYSAELLARMRDQVLERFGKIEKREGGFYKNLD